MLPYIILYDYHIVATDNTILSGNTTKAKLCTAINIHAIRQIILKEPLSETTLNSTT